LNKPIDLVSVTGREEMPASWDGNTKAPVKYQCSQKGSWAADERKSIPEAWNAD
jgi:hypothetical protein